MFNPLKDVPTFLSGQRYVVPDEGGAASEGSGEQGGSGDHSSEIDPALSDVKLDALSKLPEGERKAVLDEITKKVKNLQAIGTKKSEEYARKLEELQSKIADAKLVEDIRANPELSKAIEKTITDFQSGKLNNKSDTGDIFDEWISKAQTPEERENLIKLKDKIESGHKAVKEKVELLEKELANIKNVTRTIHTERAVRGINQLKETFGDEIVNKYNSKLTAWMSKYPQQESETFQKYIEQALFNVATPEDYRAAFRNELALKEKRETQRRKKGLEPSGAGETGREVEIPRSKSGKIDVGGFAHNLVKNLGLGKDL